MADLQQLEDSIVALSLLDAAELVKKLEARLGVSAAAAAPVMMAGGGIRGGTIVGQTNSRAEFPIERPLMPHDLLATVYEVMGVDPSLSFPDHSGRPIPILSEGKPIREIL